MKYIKHPPFENGRRTHVEYWLGVESNGKIHTITKCSEPNCELNKEADKLGV